MNAVKDPHKNISGVEVLKWLALNFWHWTKDKVIHIIIVAVCGAIIIYLTTWATLPKTLKELKTNQADNKVLLEQTIKRSDSMAGQKVDNFVFQKAVTDINKSITSIIESQQDINKKTDALYEYELGMKYKSTAHK